MTDDYCKLAGLKIHYVKQGTGTPLLILAGWGTTISVYQGLIDDMSDTYTVYCLEMPGCGSSDEPDEALTSDDYAKIVKEFIKKQNIKELNVFGHSNGGRTIIKLLGTGKKLDFDVDKIILTGCAGIVHEKSNKAKLKTKIVKAGKKVISSKLVKKLAPNAEEKLKQRMGSDDYRAASPVMRKTLVNLVNEDLRNLLPNIKQPTLLLWGEYDEATPIADGELMEELIPDSGLVMFPYSSHFAFLENRARFREIINTFLTQ
jgi:pimeloyl-ACP methyl ester carboxylesterase